VTVAASDRRMIPAPGPDARYVAGMRVDVLTYDLACETIVSWAGAGESRYVCVSAVNNVVLASEDRAFLDAMNGSDLTTPDGTPLMWALRLLGAERAERVCGPVLTPEVCEMAARRGIPVGFYGGAPDVLDELVRTVKARSPELRVSYAYSPPFRPLTEAEEATVLDEIAASGCRILFVGLGAPKQERWMAERVEALPCVLLGVGAAFDVVAGRSPRAPTTLQRLGLEWVYRLVHEPRRLWRRYLLGNPRFLWLFGRQLVEVALARRTGRTVSREIARQAVAADGGQRLAALPGSAARGDDEDVSEDAARRERDLHAA
jgi:N-acetylglucosaminyldiphosphoundecaprenol N-acetyl-beta-D-mannosaminyltransferase